MIKKKNSVLKKKSFFGKSVSIKDNMRKYFFYISFLIDQNKSLIYLSSLKVNTFFWERALD